jgi:hypothetical protein
MKNHSYSILLNNKEIGTTFLEKADVPMGVVYGNIQLEGIDNAYLFFKNYCIQNKIQITDYKEDQFLSTGHISGLSVIDRDGTEINRKAISVSGQGKTDFEIILEGVPQNIYSFKFKHHIDRYKKQFEISFQKEEIIEIGIDENIGIYIKPKVTAFPLIYRTASGVHWDDNKNILYSTNQSEWPHLTWYKQIIGIVRTELSIELCITSNTKWLNISEDLKARICEL